MLTFQAFQLQCLLWITTAVSRTHNDPRWVLVKALSNIHCVWGMQGWTWQKILVFRPGRMNDITGNFPHTRLAHTFHGRGKNPSSMRVWEAHLCWMSYFKPCFLMLFCSVKSITNVFQLTAASAWHEAPCVKLYTARMGMVHIPLHTGSRTHYFWLWL